MASRRGRPHGDDPGDTALAVLAASRRTIFAGANVRIGDARTVHRAAPASWAGGHLVYAPACHAGFGVNLSRLLPDHGAVTCGNCLRTRSGGAHARGGQLALDLDVGRP